MEDTRMKKHVTVVGAIHIGFGLLGLIGALAAFFALHFARGVVGGEEFPSVLLGFLSISVPLLVGFMATLALVGGIGLLSFQSWARYLIIVVFTPCGFSFRMKPLSCSTGKKLHNK
jgi:hypothetical protein